MIGALSIPVDRTTNFFNVFLFLGYAEMVSPLTNECVTDAIMRWLLESAGLETCNVSELGGNEWLPALWI